jgi:branched-subunit amino acid ABC-type transport system permease component
MTRSMQESIALISRLYNDLYGVTRVCFILYGILIAIGLYALCRVADPENIKWYSLIGSIQFVLLIGYFVAWLPHRRKVLDPLKEQTQQLIQELQDENK